MHLHTRRPHRKSRFGCVLCKQRRVKCDEAGPPCGNCKARAEECMYPGNDVYSAESSALTDTHVPSEENHCNAKSFSFPNTREILELQLMHRWTTCTYKSMPKIVAGEECTWQLVVPEMSLSYEFLRAGLFAMAAFETAILCANHSPQYVRAALDYQDVAIQNFQAQLCDVNAYSEEASLYFSVMLVVFSFASAQSRGTGQTYDLALQDTIGHFELIRGVDIMVMEAKDQKIKNLFPHGRGATTDKELSSVDPVWLISINKMNYLIDKRCHSTSEALTKGGLLLEACAESCTKALSHLGECVVTCCKTTELDYCLSWPCRLDSDYISAVQQRDTVALLILMHWALLAHKLESYRWWVRSYGRSLVCEISDLLLPHANSLVKELVLWIKNQL